MGDPRLLPNHAVNEYDDTEEITIPFSVLAFRGVRGVAGELTSRSCVSWMEMNSGNGRIFTILGS